MPSFGGRVCRLIVFVRGHYLDYKWLIKEEQLHQEIVIFANQHAEPFFEMNFFLKSPMRGRSYYNHFIGKETETYRVESCDSK